MESEAEDGYVDSSINRCRDRSAGRWSTGLSCQMHQRDVSPDCQPVAKCYIRDDNWGGVGPVDVGHWPQEKGLLITVNKGAQ